MQRGAESIELLTLWRTLLLRNHGLHAIAIAVLWSHRPFDQATSIVSPCPYHAVVDCIFSSTCESTADNPAEQQIVQDSEHHSALVRSSCPKSGTACLGGVPQRHAEAVCCLKARPTLQSLHGARESGLWPLRWQRYTQAHRWLHLFSNVDMIAVDCVHSARSLPTVHAWTVNPYHTEQHCFAVVMSGRTNGHQHRMLPSGMWPEWCKSCRGSGLWYCQRQVLTAPTA